MFIVLKTEQKKAAPIGATLLRVKLYYTVAVEIKQKLYKKCKKSCIMFVTVKQNEYLTYQKK